MDTSWISRRRRPLPDKSWIMTQTWRHLLFAHWPVPVAAIRPLVPPSLDVDTYDGNAWLGILPLRVEGARPRVLPALPFLSSFPQINVRTYVVSGETQGVYFFSLEAASLPAVIGAGILFRLPFRLARISLQAGERRVYCYSRRSLGGGDFATFGARYRPVSDPFEPQGGTFEEWFADRYRLYTVAADGRLFRSEINHAPWAMQHAEADIEENTLPEAIGLSTPPVQPALHYAHWMEAYIWPLQAV